MWSVHAIYLLSIHILNQYTIHSLLFFSNQFIKTNKVGFIRKRQDYHKLVRVCVEWLELSPMNESCVCNSLIVHRPILVLQCQRPRCFHELRSVEFNTTIQKLKSAQISEQCRICRREWNHTMKTFFQNSAVEIVPMSEFDFCIPKISNDQSIVHDKRWWVHRNDQGATTE